MARQPTLRQRLKLWLAQRLARWAEGVLRAVPEELEQAALAPEDSGPGPAPEHWLALLSAQERAAYPRPARPAPAHAASQRAATSVVPRAATRPDAVARPSPLRFRAPATTASSAPPPADGRPTRRADAPVQARFEGVPDAPLPARTAAPASRPRDLTHADTTTRSHAHHRDASPPSKSCPDDLTVRESPRYERTPTLPVLAPRGRARAERQHDGAASSRHREDTRTATAAHAPRSVAQDVHWSWRTPAHTPLVSPTAATLAAPHAPRRHVVLTELAPASTRASALPERAVEEREAPPTVTAASEGAALVAHATRANGATDGWRALPRHDEPAPASPLRELARRTRLEREQQGT